MYFLCVCSEKPTQRHTQLFSKQKKIAASLLPKIVPYKHLKRTTPVPRPSELYKNVTMFYFSRSQFACPASEMILYKIMLLKLFILSVHKLMNELH